VKKPSNLKTSKRDVRKPEALPDELLVAGTMGDVFDEANRYIITEA